MRRGKRLDIEMSRRVHLFERLYADLKENPYSQRTELTITFNFAAHPGWNSITTNLDDRYVWESYLIRFRQLISADDPVYLEGILRILPRYVDDEGLRRRLGSALDSWKAAQRIPALEAPLSLGTFASGRETARLYLNGGIFHSDPDLSDIWDALTQDQRRFVEHAFRSYEFKVRNVIIELKRVIERARDEALLRDRPLDLGRAGVGRMGIRTPKGPPALGPPGS